MSDSSPRAIRWRHAQAALDIVEDRLHRVEFEALENKDFAALQVVGRIRDAVADAHEMIEQVFAAATEDSG